jgi:hemoglobin-like flavoprotein
VPLFAATDLQRQKTKLLSTLVLVRNSLRDLNAIVPNLRRLGRHVAYGARPEHHSAVGETMIAAMATIPGAAWRSEHESAWQDASQSLPGRCSPAQSRTPHDAAYRAAG